MEEFKRLNELIEMDEKHRLKGMICGTIPSLEGMHQYLSEVTLNDEVPEDIKGQFNVARNMAIYTYFFYALAPEVHLKTYILIEYALATKANSEKSLSFKQLMGLAIQNEWIRDSGFRHIKDPSPNNEWCKSMVKTIPNLRNPQAHSPGLLVGDCLHHITTCADFINQLYPNIETRNKSVQPTTALTAD